MAPLSACQQTVLDPVVREQSFPGEQVLCTSNVSAGFKGDAFVILLQRRRILGLGQADYT